MRTITLEQLHKELQAQGVGSCEHFAFVCVACGTIQSGQDFINAGAGRTFQEVLKYVGFSCVGRFTEAGPPVSFEASPCEGRGCNWTLGGLFHIHKLEIVTPEGDHCALFEPATPQEAQAHEAINKRKS
jgi:hypothetical protein